MVKTKTWVMGAIIGLLGASIGLYWLLAVSVTVLTGAALFPEPDLSDPAAPRIAALLNAESKLPVETEEENQLELHDFDPLKVASSLVRPEFLPQPEKIKIIKKRKWWPYWEAGQLQPDGGADAAIVRYEADGFSVQINSARLETSIYFRRQHGKLDLAPDESARQLPKAVTAVLRPEIRKVVQPTQIQAGKVSGDTFEHWMLDGILLPAEIQPHAYPLDVFWTSDCIVFSLQLSRPRGGRPPDNVPIFQKAAQTRADNVREDVSTTSLTKRAPIGDDGTRDGIPKDVVEELKNLLHRRPDAATATRDQVMSWKENVKDILEKTQQSIDQSPMIDDPKERHARWTAAADIIALSEGPFVLRQSIAASLIKAGEISCFGEA